MTKKIGIELCFQAALAHGKDSDPEHEVGDLQQLLRRAWEILTPGQRLEFMAGSIVSELIEANLPKVDVEEAFDKLVAEQRKVLSTQQKGKVRRIDVFSAIVTEFPGFLNDTDVDGGDLVDWVSRNLGAFR